MHKIAKLDLDIACVVAGRTAAVVEALRRQVGEEAAELLPEEVGGSVASCWWALPLLFCVFAVVFSLACKVGSKQDRFARICSSCIKMAGRYTFVNNMIFLITLKNTLS